MRAGGPVGRRLDNHQREETVKPVRFAAFAALVVFVLGLFSLSVPVAEAKDKPNPKARHCILKTQKILVRAHHAVKKGHEGKADFRAAWIHQRAAWKQIHKDHPAVAAKLSLLARAAARKAIQANKGELKGEEATDSADDTAAAEGASEADVTAAVTAETATAPSEEDVLKEEPKEEEK